MTKKYLSGVLILALSFVLCIETQGQTRGITPPGGFKGPPGLSSGELAGIIAGVVVGVVVVVVLVVHYSKKRTITGCVSSGPDGMTVTNEGDKQVYTLSGDTGGVKPGERMKLQGSKLKANTGKPLIWDTKKISKDFGVCQP